MARIRRQDVEHIANLARLSLSGDEIERMTRELDQILEYASALQQLDTDGIEATAHAIPLPTPLREDRAASTLDPLVAVANAPERDGTAFVVPKVLASDEEG